MPDTRSPSPTMLRPFVVTNPAGECSYHGFTVDEMRMVMEEIQKSLNATNTASTGLVKKVADGIMPSA